jgi:purine-binding chemotaxis protein CheW
MTELLSLNSTLSNLSTPDLDDLDERQAIPFIKVLVFSIGSLNLGLRIDYVYKVLNSTQVYGSGLSGVGLAHMGEREVTVLDLARRLLPENQPRENIEGGFLIVIEDAQSGDLYGIPVAIVPVLIDVPLPSIRVLPASFRNSDTLGIASHVAVLSEAETSMTLFLLDVNILTAL